MDYLVVSENRTFLVSQYDGNIQPGGALGLYHHDMRHLSELELRLNGTPPTFLNFSDRDVYRASILLGNGRFETAEGNTVPGNSIGIRREFVVADALRERLTLSNYNHFAVRFDLAMQLGADFADIFLVRAFGGAIDRGSVAAPEQENEQLVLAYHGKDGVTRTTAVGWSVPPTKVETELQGPDDPGGAARPLETTRSRLQWRVELAPRQEQTIDLVYRVDEDLSATDAVSSDMFDREVARLQESYRDWAEAGTQVSTDNAMFDEVLQRSAMDLRALTGSYQTGPLPHAGIPWFAVPFGRDSLITSLQTLCYQPGLAVGILRFMAAYQGTKDDPWRDETPGKIIHEIRFGEMAGMGAVPHTPYYGSVDATPLFLMLFAQVLQWTADEGLWHELRPNVLAALDWLDQYGDLDGDGFLEFVCRSENGLRIQGWKDSWNSVIYPDGRLVEPPMALVEVQGYAYAARTWLLPILRRFGETERAAKLEREAAALQERFNRDFWLEDLGFYAQSLDQEKHAVPEVTSNPGHVLMSGIMPQDRAAKVAERLVQPDMASGWGIRTRAASDPSYNPMAYHNGSVWPHDNSLIIDGLRRSGFRDAANKIASEIIAAAEQFPRYRLPELMCGFGRDEGAEERPADYPATCSPQAWAAGTPYLILQSILGLEADAWNNRLYVDPHLPAWLNRVEVRNLRVGSGRVHFAVSLDGVQVVADGGVEVKVGPTRP